MLIIGLTGGIGSGKTTVTQRFADLGVPVIDADSIAHQLTEKDQPALEMISAYFGSNVLTSEGELDRSYLRHRIFNNPDDKKALEDILHPLIRLEIKRQVAGLDDPYCIICIPLLLESGLGNSVDRILVIDVSRDIQIQRAAQRDNLPAKEIEAIIDSQIDRESRLNAADDIIDNNSDRNSLVTQVDSLHEKYLQLSNSDTGN